MKTYHCQGTAPVSRKYSLKAFLISSVFLLKLSFLIICNGQSNSETTFSHYVLSLSHVTTVVDFVTKSWWYVFTDFFLSILCKTTDVKTNVDILLSFKLFLTEKKSEHVYPNAKCIFRYYLFTWQEVVKYGLIMCAMALRPWSCMQYFHSWKVSLPTIKNGRCFCSSAL